MEKGARDVIVFPNLKILKKKGLIANTNAICSKGELLLKFFNPFATGVKISKQDNLAFGLKADKNFQSYLDRALVRKIRRNLEKNGKAIKTEEIENVMSLAEDEVFDKGEICQMGKKRNKDKYTPLTKSEAFDQKHFAATQEERNNFITEKFKLNENTNL